MIAKIVDKLKREYNERLINPALVIGKPKIFCIGRNKTGTTSLRKAFEDLDFIIGNKHKAARLLPYYAAGNFERIIKFCLSAQMFKDVPFSLPDTFRHLDKAFPGSKFILTVRDSPEQWYQSVTKFHAKIYGHGKLPSKDDLQKAGYIWKGWAWEYNRVLYNTPENDLYNKETFINSYNNYNQSVTDYFKTRENSLVVINVSEKGSYGRLMNFLQIDSPFTEFPWENKTEKLVVG